MLPILFCLVASAQIQVVDHLSEFISRYEALPTKNQETVKDLILKNEQTHKSDFEEVYGFDRADAGDAAEKLITHFGALRSLHKEFRALVFETETRYQKIFGIELTFPIQIWYSLGTSDGKTTTLNKVDGFSINFRYRYTAEELKIILAHEAFHLVQNTRYKNDPPSPLVEGTLIREGWATFASSLIFPGLPDWKYLSYFKKDDAQFREFKKLDSEIRKSIAKDLDSNTWDVGKKYFSGDPKDSAPFPPRSGYYLGFMIAKHLAARQVPREVALLGSQEISKSAREFIKK
jgi:uncharacterized protein YjaZ